MITYTKNIATFFILTLLSTCKIEDPWGFTIGVNNQNVNLVTTNSTAIVGQYGNPSSKIIDVDGNGINDFEIQSGHWGSPGGYRYYESGIIVLNGAFSVSTIDITDTLFYCSYYNPDSILQKVRYNNFSSYECPTTGTDSIISIQSAPYPIVYQSGYTPDLSETWNHNYLHLANIDTSRYMHSPYFIPRGTWNGEIEKYILFRKSTGNKPLYGWIKVSVKNHYRIRVHEYAMEKN